jgi:hypothetical protein
MRPVESRCEISATEVGFDDRHPVGVELEPQIRRRRTVFIFALRRPSSAEAVQAWRWQYANYRFYLKIRGSFAPDFINRA